MIKVGSRVRYISKEVPRVAMGCYPPIGTLGTVERLDNDTTLVRWDSGTESPGIWWCGNGEIEEFKPSMSREDLLNLIEEKVNEVFLAYQEANDIPSGDIAPFDAMQLQLTEKELAELIIKVSEVNKK